MEVVDGWTEPERIEMAVTSNDDPGDGWSGGEPAAPVGDRRVLTVATITAVMALLVGWFIGYSARSHEAAPAAATTTEATDTTVAEPVAVETLPLPATTRPRRTTTTTTLAPPSVEVVEIDPRLAGIDLTLVGAASNGSHLELLELDLDARTVTHTDLGRFYSGVEWMLAGHDWALFVSGQGTGLLVRDGEPPISSVDGEIWERRWEVGTGRSWRLDHESEWAPNGPSVWRQHDIHGEPTGVTLELPFNGWVELVDPAGGLVMETTGKHYSIDSSGATLIGTGHLLGLSADVAVFWNCDDQLRCGPEVVDRQTGVVRTLDADPSSDRDTQLEGLWGWGEMAGTTISPDGEACAVMVMGERSVVLGLLEFDSGTVVELGETWWMPALAWSPDARYAFYLRSENGAHGHLWAYDRESGEAFSVFDEPREWTTLSARPAAG